MIESIEFDNFKSLRKTTLPLAPFTLLLGPNGSGKTSVLQALQGIAALSAQGAAGNGTISSAAWLASPCVTSGLADVTIKLRIRWHDGAVVSNFVWQRKPGSVVSRRFHIEDGSRVLSVSSDDMQEILTWFSKMQIFTLDANAIAQPTQVSSGPLKIDGAGLAAVLDDLKDNHPERWELLLAEMRRWIPEYDYILFDKPQPGLKGIVLRTRKAGHRIPAHELSQGTLIALALLTLAYMPNPPTVVGLEEIDRGLHPRLLRHLQDALYRLSYPEICGETRPPIQVIATTHSPYLLDLYRDHPNEVVLAQKEGLEVSMKRLSDIEHYQEILGDTPLSEIWYSGVLGGAAVRP